METYNNAQEDINHQKSVINIFNIFDIHFQAGASVIEFYNQYRNMIIMNLKRRGDIILWQNERVLDGDEELSPTFEDMILANVLGLVDCHLLLHVRDNFSQVVGGRKSLMDYKEEILDMVSLFLSKNDATLPAKVRTKLEELGR